MKYLWLLLALLLPEVALAQPITYPQCPINNNPTSCTMTVHVTSAVTPIFKALSAREYLFLQNTGYTLSASLPQLNNNPVFCSINSGNAPKALDATASNVIVIQPGGVYEPPQIVRAQTAFTVPSGDISCVAPLGDVWLTIEEE